MRVGVAEDGESAFRSLEEEATGDDPYVVVLLDMCMPGMNGLQLATHISANSALEHTALVLLTSAQELRLEEAREAGISAQLTKPTHMSRLKGALHDALGLTRPDPNKSVGHISQPRAPGSRGHLLIAEDNHVNQLVAVGMLERLGYTTEVASNGIEAVAAFDLTRFSAVLMDCRMPEMDGYVATETIRRRGERGRGVPIIAMTASATESERQRCLTAGMDDFISKPVDPEVLDRTLSRWVSHTQEEADTPANVTPLLGRPVLDESRLETLRTLKPGDSSLLDRVVTAFLSSSAECLTMISEALQARSASDLGNAAHQLKGSAAQVGAPRVAAVCDELEHLAELGDLEPAPEALSRLLHELDSVTAALQALTAK